jgi:spermidine/putrescine transport system permease protein
MDFIMQPEISAEISAEFPYGNPNVASHEFIDEEILSDEAVYPAQEHVKKGEYLRDIGETITELDRIWSEVKQ